MNSRDRMRCFLVALSMLVLGSGPAAASVDSCPNALGRTGPSEALPDCRAYEQVSPVEKNGADAVPMGRFSFPAQASVPAQASEPSAFEYMSVGPFEGATAGGDNGAMLPNAYVSTLEQGVWRTRNLSPPTPQAPPMGVFPLGYDFSEDLSRFVVKMPPEQLTAQAPSGVYNLYLHQPDGSFSLITTAPPTTPLAVGCEACFQNADLPAFAGASSDYSHTIFEVTESLTPGVPGPGVPNLYESVGGAVRPVGVLPDGTIAPGGSVPGSGLNVFYSAVQTVAAQRIDHAISQDGSHIVFQALADSGPQVGLTEVYDRVDGATTAELSAPAPGASPANTTPEPAQFWAASADGRLVLFTSRAELTTASNTGFENAGQDLYEYNTISGSLTDLTVDSSPADTLSGTGVRGVVGSSTDGAYVYFVATGQLLPGAGIDGEPNLYVSHEGSLAFIATLGETDAADWTSAFANLRAYVTPDGRHLAFTSKQRLTGYENTDQSTGLPDGEIYEYTYAGSGVNPVCVSCDPSGERPAGSAFIGARLTQQTNTAFHLSRALSDDGSRAFFSSPDALAEGAGGPYEKVYEYESGHVHLISAGANETGDSILLDASPSGDDVFFATRDQLVSDDQDHLIDVYDAHVDGNASPQAPVAPCSGSICQGPSPLAPSLPSPQSTVFTAQGNLPAPASDPAAKTKPRKPKPKPKKSKKPKAKKKKKKPKAGKQGRKARAGRRRAVGHGRKSG